ncbi:DUF4352 domain-containing protein [Heyndrickxia vini]|uniref:DUF4352 domain-containing protein n=1 Tax=Heyndrickxia vini TaxID=1476025 RepID=A0ABX7E4C8_9BACI|nr:DUF4352 domain-containing protein [Heyndrickxia vini]QQZ10431.1 DUF4352 domain-containing protein [Heyndrickxia vini]
MRKLMCFIGTIIVCFSILTACQSTDDNKKASAKNNDKTSQIKVNDTNKQSTDNEQKSKSDLEGKNGESVPSSGDFKDQTDLKLGDTGQVESTVGKYEITIHSVKMIDEIDGQSPSLDHFFVVEVTVKNIGNKPIDAIEPIKTLELTSNPDGGGNGDDSSFYKSINALTGVIEPGKSVSGEAVFQEMDAKTYYLRTNVGLIAAKAVKNKTTWTFEKSEAK